LLYLHVKFSQTLFGVTKKLFLHLVPFPRYYHLFPKIIDVTWDWTRPDWGNWSV